jgi:uncharacterized membrane protein
MYNSSYSMKKILFLLLIFIFIYSPHYFHALAADNDFTINNFHSDTLVQNSGIVKIQETIIVDFPSEHHGIFRYIPYEYQNQSGKITYTDVSVQKVQRDGADEKYSTSLSNGNIEIKIGDPDITINGIHTYTIDYTEKGILRHYSGYDELYWNVTGSEWGVPISSASATVRLAKDGIRQISCYQGVRESTQPCSNSTYTANTARFSASGLNPGEGLTVAVGYTAGLFPILTVSHSIKEISILKQIVLGVVPVLITLTVMIYLWMKKGRDLLMRQKYLFDPNAKEDTRPLGYKDTIVVEYTPPDKLRPAEMGVLVDEKADQLDVTATIIDLATRGYLTIREVPKKWMFGSVDYTLIRTKKSTGDLLSYESELLNRLFETGNLVTISSLKQKFYKDLKIVENKLNDDVVSKKFFAQSPDKTRTMYRGTGIAVMVIGFFFLTVIGGLLSWFGLGVGLIISGGIIALVASFMPRRTAQGAEMLRRIKGYQLFISGAEKYKQQFFEKKNMFNEILPYAIVFGLTEKFAKAMKDMGIEPTQPSWYIGSGPFNTMLFASQMNAFSSSMSQVIASTPSGSGSGGGGFSGGGFGGGGGGGW